MVMFKREQLIDHVGAYRTQSLFMETNQSALPPILTLKEVDWEWKGATMLSLKKIYLEIADVTEYEFAIEVFGYWKCWQRILANKALRAHIDEWREELEVKMRSAGVRALAETAVTAGSKGTAAAKYLADKGWDKRKAGAPSKEEVVRERKTHARVKNEVEDDMKRLGLH